MSFQLEPQACRECGWFYVAMLFSAMWVVDVARADATYVYAVQISAVVQTNPPQIHLSWEPDPYGADNFVVFRKLKTDASWGAGILLPGSATNFTDVDVTDSAAYEYQIIKHAALGYTGYGYIYSGISAPLIEDRGTVVLVVAADTVSLAKELQQLQSDLVGDGWSVIRHDVSSSDTPSSVKTLIVSDYQSDPARVQAVFLFGHVPIVMAGDIDYDSHGPRALPADGFYGDMTGDWRLDQDPTNRPSFFPAPIKLMVGRVDFFDMPGIGASVPWPNETELLRRYLNKDHAWRYKQVTVPRRALWLTASAISMGRLSPRPGIAISNRSLDPVISWKRMSRIPRCRKTVGFRSQAVGGGCGATGAAVARTL